MTITECPNCKRVYHPGAGLLLLECACGWVAKITAWGWWWFKGRKA